jgi:SAM-dependent methyltransferase
MPTAPAAWLLQHTVLMPVGRRVLDVASGQGRHALFLAAAGWSVHAVDRDESALTALRGSAAALRGVVTTECLDLETVPPPSLGVEEYGAVIVFNYLHRPLLPALVRAVEPGGVLIYETFTVGQARRGRPTNPAFLLEDGELATLVAPLDVLRAREGDVDGNLVSSIVAVRRQPADRDRSNAGRAGAGGGMPPSG